MFRGGDDLGAQARGGVKLLASAGRLGDTVTVPDADVLFRGDYHRSGTDLVLSGDGKTFVVQDYFANAHFPTLLSPQGAALTDKVVAALAGPEHPGQYAQAGPPAGQVPLSASGSGQGGGVLLRRDRLVVQHGADLQVVDPYVGQARPVVEVEDELVDVGTGGDDIPAELVVEQLLLLA